jgi:hypothetical protein
MKSLKQITFIATALLVTSQAQAAFKEFSFQYKSAQPQETVQSDPITIEGLEAPVTAKIQGEGVYLLNGKEMGKVPHIIRNGDRISLKQTALPSENARVSTTMLVGEIYNVFTVTTKTERTDR